MNDITIYHNPACGTSRNVLALIRNTGDEPTVIEYLKTPPDRATLKQLIAAIGISARYRSLRPAVLYAGLFGSLGLAWLLPPEQLLIDPPALRYALAAGLAFAPIMFANLIFAHSFRDTAMADMSFASNLLGAMVGGALEYIALITGYRALLIVVGALYAVAYVLAGRWRVLADRDLVRRDMAGPSGAEPEPLPSVGG